MDENHLNNTNTINTVEDKIAIAVTKDHEQEEEINKKSLIEQVQLCSSCRYEKACVICSICNETQSIDNFASNENIASQLNCSQKNNEINITEDKDLYQNQLTEQKTEEFDLNLLTQKGNMVYCNECFKDVHKAMLKTHVPVEIFQKSSFNNTNQSKLEQESFDLNIKETYSENNDQNIVVTTTECKYLIQNDQNKIEEEVHSSNASMPEKIITTLKEQNIDIVDLLNELVSISSSHYEQEELNRKATQAAVIQTKMTGIFDDLKNLNLRSEQFNDVKLSIKQMNDLIRNDVFLDFGTINTMIRTKLDEVTNTIKEKLKDAYSVVRDTQIKIVNKVTEIKELADRIQMLEALRLANNIEYNSSNSIDLPFSFHDDSTEKISDEEILNQINKAYEKINDINEDLRKITESSEYRASLSSVDTSTPSNSCSLFVDNNLYPKFNYFIDTRKLVEAIQEINVEIGSTDILNPKTYFLGKDNENLDLPPAYSNHSTFLCTIQSGISNEGSFWVQLNFPNGDDHLFDTDKNNNITNYDHLKRNQSNKINMFIEEISKYIRCKRIGDKTWQTYTEASRVPKKNEKCFCLEPKTRKWLRAKVKKYEKNICTVSFMDISSIHSDANKFTLDNILIWKDFDLAMYPARVVKCVLKKTESSDLADQYVKNICLETKFYFKDNFANKTFKCELIEPLKDEPIIQSDELTWIVDLKKIIEKVKQDEISLESVNKLIIDYNDHECLVLQNKATNKNKFSSIDIRVESGKVGVSNQLVKTKCEQDNKQSDSLIISHSFSGQSNANNIERQTDSDSTAKACDTHNIASSVNSFSEKLVEEISKSKENEKIKQISEQKTHTCALSLPIIQNTQNLPMATTIISDAKERDSIRINKASSIEDQEYMHHQLINSKLIILRIQVNLI